MLEQNLHGFTVKQENTNNLENQLVEEWVDVNGDCGEAGVLGGGTAWEMFVGRFAEES